MDIEAIQELITVKDLTIIKLRKENEELKEKVKKLEDNLLYAAKTLAELGIDAGKRRLQELENESE